MPNTREKLIERFAERLKEAYPFGDRNNPSPSIYYDDFCDIVDEVAAEIIDSISNGVTVQEWIPASVPPKEDGKYLIHTITWGVSCVSTAWFKRSLKYEQETQKNVWYEEDETGYFQIDSVAHWMPLTQPPKGE